MLEYSGEFGGVFGINFEKAFNEALRAFFGANLHRRFFCFNRYIVSGGKLLISCPTQEASYNISNYYLDGIYRVWESLQPNERVRVIVQFDPSLSTGSEPAKLKESGLELGDNRSNGNDGSDGIGNGQENIASDQSIREAISAGISAGTSARDSVISATLHGTSRISAQIGTQSGANASPSQLENSLLQGNVILSNFEPKKLQKGNMSFETFILDKSNEMALMISKHFAGLSGEVAALESDLLFLHGDVGRGKTHLAKSILLANQERGESALYFSAESFTNEFISALREKKAHDFKSRIASAQTLIVDDLHSLIGRKCTISELSKIIGFMLDNGRRVVLTSTQKSCAFEASLKSRISSGVSIGIGAPTRALKQKIAHQMVSSGNIPITLDDADFLVENIGGGIRELKGAMGRIAVSASVNGEVLTRENVRSIVEDLLADSHKPSFVPHQNLSHHTQRAVCAFLDISLPTLLSGNKTQKVAYARNLGMYICRQDLKMSLQSIAGSFARNSHNAVISGIKSIESKMTEKKTLADLESIRRVISRARLQY